jgi:aspartate carbamoyltransferase
MSFPLKHVLSTAQFDDDLMQVVFEEARRMEKILDSKKQSIILKGKILATLFWEPSTRTRFSFESAMLRLGGNLISNFSMGTSSSITKGETLYDTAKTVSNFADIIAMRHPDAFSVEEFSMGSSVPVINGGDGANDHPTQGLLDIYTIWKWRKYGSLEKAFNGLTIGMIGDLKNSRVVHAQCELLKFFKCRFILVSPEALKIPPKYLDILRDYGSDVYETDDLEGFIGDFDVLSDTRIQQERFSSKEEFEKYRIYYQIGAKLLKNAKEKMILLAPLPRFGELLSEVDIDPRAKYFEQIRNGVAVRMGLFKLLLS